MNSAMGGLAKRLVEENLINPAQARTALDRASRRNISFEAQLTQSRLVSSAAIARSVSRQFQTPYLDLDAFDCTRLPLKLVDEKLINRHQVLPLYKRGKILFVAVSNPGLTAALNEIRFQTGCEVRPIVVDVGKLTAKLNALFSHHQFPTAGNSSSIPVSQQTRVPRRKPSRSQRKSDTAEKNSTIQFVNALLLDAIRQGASDIHIEPYEHFYRIRFRLDGTLSQVPSPGPELSARIASRIKVMAQLDISEKRVPQDGRISMRPGGDRVIHVRVSTLPTSWGEKIVLRLLDSDKNSLEIDQLGFEPRQKALYLQALQQQQGMILISGPTGSGKTVSLYSGLQRLNAEERNISTAEDPIEVSLEGINQVAVNNRIGLDFATALRAFLRQDPDVVMVGEIRDLETAEIAVRAAQTGHLVLSTLHTNSAAEIVTRLRSMGIPPYNLAASVRLVIAQRLARRLCSRCKESVELPEKLYRAFEKKGLNFSELKFCRPRGCQHCVEGFKGRIGIYEVVPITAPMSQIIMDGGNSIQLNNEARKEGFPSLRDAALIKAAQGLISLEEAYRLT